MVVKTEWSKQFSTGFMARQVLEFEIYGTCFETTSTLQIFHNFPSHAFLAQQTKSHIII